MPQARNTNQLGLVSKYLAPLTPPPGSPSPNVVSDLSSVGVLSALDDGIGRRGTDILNKVRAGIGSAVRPLLNFGNGPCFAPPVGPRGLIAAGAADLVKRHGDIAAQHLSLDLPWFKSMVQNKARWDYKQGHPELQDFGNYHYGYVGTRQGIPEGILRMGAGYAQLKANTSQPSFITSYFDDPNDQRQIMRGANDARNGCY